MLSQVHGTENKQKQYLTLRSMVIFTFELPPPLVAPPCGTPLWHPLVAHISSKVFPLLTR